MYLLLIRLLRRQRSTPPSVGFADISLRWRESSPREKPFSSLSVLPQGRGLLLPCYGHYRVVENQSLPLTREVSKPQVLTEGEKSDVLQNLRFFSLSHLPLTAFPKVVKPPPLSQPFG